MSTETTQPAVSADVWTAEHDRPIPYRLGGGATIPLFEVEGELHREVVALGIDPDSVDFAILRTMTFEEDREADGWVRVKPVTRRRVGFALGAWAL